MPFLQFQAQLNTSLQLGDEVYCLDGSLSQVGGYENNDNDPILFGAVIDIDRDNYSVEYDTLGINTPVSISSGLPTFIMFSKDKRVNTSGLKGYYAEVKFLNATDEYAELFSIASEINESSK